MAGSKCASLSGSAVVTVSTHSDSESVASASASEHKSSYASSSLQILHVFCVYRHVIHVGNIIFDMVIK